MIFLGVDGWKLKKLDVDVGVLLVVSEYMGTHEFNISVHEVFIPEEYSCGLCCCDYNGRDFTGKRVIDVRSHQLKMLNWLLMLLNSAELHIKGDCLSLILLSHNIIDPLQKVFIRQISLSQLTLHLLFDVFLKVTICPNFQSF